MTHYEDIPCLAECDERHADECPRYAAEAEHYKRIYGRGQGCAYVKPTQREVDDMIDAGRITESGACARGWR